MKHATTPLTHDEFVRLLVLARVKGHLSDELGAALMRRWGMLSHNTLLWITMSLREIVEP